MSSKVVIGYKYQAYSFGQEDANHPFYQRIFVPSFHFDFSGNGGVLGGRNAPCVTVAQQKLLSARESGIRQRSVETHNDMLFPTDLTLVAIPKDKLDQIQQLYNEFIVSRDYEAKKREASFLIQSLFK